MNQQIHVVFLVKFSEVFSSQEVEVPLFNYNFSVIIVKPITVYVASPWTKRDIFFIAGSEHCECK